ncbi:MAG TPA: hypothetical protein VMZ71_04575 [Gemmataceae bacterium]|nr:hypothetical protein [Gemmataceae bacterium]
MPIPMTCSGCHASFDVPDNLAGKTIRCTSCKAQMTIPAAGEKKPFGWATKTPPAAVIELDDEPAPVKTAAKPAVAVKAAPKAAVVVDDDEDDSPKAPKKAAPKQLSGIKGAPPGMKSATKAAVARRKVEDDDDDDDDDTPRRGKKKAAAGGSNVAILAGGGLALCAVIGVAVWMFAFKGDKADKTDSASSSSSTPASTSGSGGGRTPDIGTRPNGPPAGMGVGGGAAGASGLNGAWQPVQGEGFTCEMPGQAQVMTQTQQGTTVKVHMVGDGQREVILAMAVNLPGPIPATAQGQLYNEMAKAFEQGANGGGGGFGLQAKVKVAGTSDFQLDQFNGRELILNDGGGKQVGVMRLLVAGTKLFLYGGASDKFAANSGQIQRMMASFKVSDGSAGGGNEVANGGLPAGRGAGRGGLTPPGGSTGNEGEAPTSSNPGGGRGSPSGPPGAFQPPGGEAPTSANPGGGRGGPPPGMVGPPTSANPGGGGFVPPNGGPPPGMVGPRGGGDGVAGAFGQPPGGGGLTPLGPPGGQPPGGPPPGFQGGGAFGGFGGGFGSPDDNIPISPPIEPFYAAAFDAEKKQLITIGMRPRTTPQSRAQAVLRLYEYPAFALKGTYNIPHVGTRIVIDTASEKGLMYVASVNTVPAAWSGGPMAVERNAAVGDIEVYELDQIRSGKTEPGKDFKPLGTIGVGGTIRGLELSPDGKTLFCLNCANTATAKATLHQYDTAERKTKAGTKPIQFSMAAWNLRTTPDGKSLLVVERGAKVEVGTYVLRLDMDAPEKRAELPLTGSASDVAVVKKDGTIFTAVQSATGGGKLFPVDPEKSVSPTEISQAPGKLSNGYYIGTDPDGKFLFVSSSIYGGQNVQGGFDAYEVTDRSPGGLKKLASARVAGGRALQGAFLVAPDGEYVVFHIGTVLKVADLKNATAGFGGGGGAAPPGAFQPPGGAGAFPPPAGGGVVPVLPQGPPTSANPGGGRPGGAAPGGMAPLPPPGFGTQGGGAPGPKGSN